MSNTNRLRLKVYVTIGLAVVIVAGLAWLGNGGPTAQANAQADKDKAAAAKNQAVPVELAAVRRGEMVTFVSATANLRPLREVEIASRTEGVVKQVLVEEGHQVKEGQVLCTLDDTQLRIQLQSARQKLAQARLQVETARIQEDKTAVQVENAREDLNRNEALFKEQLVSERDVAQARYRLRELEHDARVSTSQTEEYGHRVQELEAEVERVSLEIGRTEVRAPFGGCIVSRMVEVGRTVRNLDALYKLSAFSPLYADVFLSEGEARLVRPGQPASLRLGVDESRRVSGRVDRISPVVDQTTGTVKVTVELNGNETGFKPGAFVRVSIQTERRADAILIPKRSVLDEDGAMFVYVAEQKVARKVAVTLGSENDGSVEVRQGLKEGQKVVVAGQGALKDGAAIRIPDAGDKKGSDLAATKRTHA
jgi:membrane fusion protein (multidrug efflux system)